ncbi:ABC transporter ATP-binding protein [Streptomyces shenzhenensis]|uniref:ABC transporter ATP-binding protein n=1 Tax=Streptomyces shenzhenensis TaxID=943815 RepID=UPI0033D376E3
MGSTLRLASVAKSFGATAAVHEVDLDIAPGEFVVLLGPSGCGKTTTLRMIAGFEEPTSGAITLGERVLSQKGHVVPPERRQMGMVFQSYAIWPHMTVFDNVAYGLKLRKQGKAEITENVHRALATVQMDGYAERYPAELSGGQQQRIAFARAIAVNPELLLMDEPLSNLDARLRDAMRFELRRLHQELGFTTIYVTHDQAEAMAIADRIVVLNQGRIEQVGTPAELYRTPATPFVAGFLGQAKTVGVAAAGDGGIRMGDVAVPASALITAHSAPEGTPFTAVLRPSSFERTGQDDTSGGVLEAEVRESIFLGEILTCRIWFPQLREELEINLNPFDPVKKGDLLKFRLQYISLIAAEHEQDTAGEPQLAAQK